MDKKYFRKIAKEDFTPKKLFWFIQCFGVRRVYTCYKVRNWQLVLIREWATYL